MTTLFTFLERVGGTLKPRSFVDYEIQVGHLQAYFDERRDAEGRELRAFCVHDLSACHVHGLINWQLARGRERGTADKARRAILAIWSKAAEMGEANPAPKIKALQPRKHEPTAWSFEEFEDLLWGVSRLDGPPVGPFSLADWFETAVRLTYNSGLRLDTAMNTRWDWLNLGDGLLVVPPEFQKDDEGTIVKLKPSTVDCLAMLAEKKTNGEVFGDWPFDRTVVQWPALTLRLRQAIVAGELRKSVDQVTKRDLWHKLRRTFATHLYAETHDIELVRDALGHSSINVTYRYIDKSKCGRKLPGDILTDPRPHKLRSRVQ